MLFRSSNWSRWVTFNNGAFTKYLDDAHRVASGGKGGDLDQAALNTETLNSHSVGPAGPGGALSLNNRNVNISVKVDMHMNVANLNKGELGRTASELRKAIENEFRVKLIAGN